MESVDAKFEIGLRIRRIGKRSCVGKRVSNWRLLLVLNFGQGMGIPNEVLEQALTQKSHTTTTMLQNHLQFIKQSWHEKFENIM